uniref:Ovule protein n=1 Tax=Loa loa TaxID=7209 RepID=A0A1I7VF90_LOALO
MEKLFLLAEVAAKMPEAKLAAKNADKFDSRESSGYPEDIIEVQDQSSNSSSSPANIKVHMGTHIAGRPYSSEMQHKLLSSVNIGGS